MSQQLDRLVRVRASGAVKRCHTHQYHGSYSVAEHCWQMLALAVVVVPEDLCTPKFMTHVLLHDVAEVVMGDIPAVVKWAHPDLKKLLDTIEIDVEQQLLGIQGLPKLTEEQVKWLKLLDIIELGMWCVDQLSLGNQTVLGILKTCYLVGSERFIANDLIREILQGFERVLKSENINVEDK